MTSKTAKMLILSGKQAIGPQDSKDPPHVYGVRALEVGFQPIEPVRPSQLPMDPSGRLYDNVTETATLRSNSPIPTIRTP